MMPTPIFFEYPHERPTSPELRRMEMFNRARREETNVMLFAVPPRYTAGLPSRHNRRSESVISRLISGMRSGIGNSLTSVGNRIHSSI